MVDFKAPVKLSIISKSDKNAFIPHGENFNYPLSKGESIEFITDSDNAMCYAKQATKDLVVVKDGIVDAKLELGQYDSAEEEFTEGASFRCLPISKSFDSTTKVETINLEVIGTIPYLAADATIGMVAGNRFTIKLTNPDIEAKSDLPSGSIASILVPGETERTYTKSGFEDDGSLIASVNINDARELTISVQWYTSSAEKTTSKYVFTFYESEYAKENEEVSVLHSVVLKEKANITLTNNSSLKVGFVPYRDNSVKFIEAGDSLVLTSENAEESMYYIRQANEKLAITYENID